MHYLATQHFEIGAQKAMLPFRNFHMAESVDNLWRNEGTQRSRSASEPFSVHMMGTCRMGSRPERSVANLDGELRDLPDCYVADASLVPTVVGVNPQLTIMALAMRVAQRRSVPN
jgi:choline dehydrogenase-like flavoprotein